MSIPKAYYWQTENYEVPINVKIWHRTVATLGSIARGAESVGETMASVMGLGGTGELDYVMSTMTEEGN